MWHIPGYASASGRTRTHLSGYRVNQDLADSPYWIIARKFACHTPASPLNAGATPKCRAGGLVPSSLLPENVPAIDRRLGTYARANDRINFGARRASLLKEVQNCVQATKRSLLPS